MMDSLGALLLGVMGERSSSHPMCPYQSGIHLLV
jgi:hypothetical protein